MMKAQEDLVTMVKSISNRVDDLEKAVTSKSATFGAEENKLPPALSVS